MFRRVYGSRAIPRAAWGALHISTMAQANRLCPPLVPLGCVTAPAVAGAALMVPLAEALASASTSGVATGGDVAGSAFEDLFGSGSTGLPVNVAHPMQLMRCWRLGVSEFPCVTHCLSIVRGDAARVAASC